MKLHYRLSVFEDICYLAERLREADNSEIEAAGSTPKKALLEGLMLSSPSYTIVGEDGVPIGMFGAVPITCEPVDTAVVWMLGTPGIERNWVSFLRQSRAVLKDLYSGYSVLTNFVDARNELHIKWLKWLGFIAVRVTPAGPHNYLFYEFVRIKDHV